MMGEGQAVSDTKEMKFTRYNVTCEAKDLEDVMKFIRQFADGETVWFRGHKSCEHTLLPTLYRGVTVDFFNGQSYSSIHREEDMRIQQYYAREYPYIKDSGCNTVEWIGMGQHFGLKTRFLDWSQSAIHSLTFALEKYVENAAYEGEEIPCLWVLKPQEMNRRIINSVMDSEWSDKYKELYCRDMRENDRLNKMLDDMRNREAEFKRVFLESDGKSRGHHMDYIYNLSYFDRLLEKVKMNPSMAFTGNVLNPIYIILAMNYIDGTVTGDEWLDTVPLASLHPLNSERIREQRGTFTVFPFPSAERYKDNGNKMDFMRMETNSLLNGTLCRIVLLHPRGICKGLKSLGVHKTWLYNEPDRIGEEIESGQ